MSGELVIEVIPDGSTGPAERPPRRFAQLRLAVLIAAVLVLVGGAVYGPGLVRDALIRPEAVLHGLRPIGAEPLTHTTDLLGHVLSTATSAETVIVNGRAVAIVQGFGDDLELIGLDLVTGAPAWSSVDLGSWKGYKLFGLPQALVVVTAPVVGEPGPLTMMVVDPTSGRLRWTTKVVSFVPYDSDMVVVDPDLSTMRALDWGSGHALWQRTIPAGARVDGVSPGTFELPRLIIGPPRVRTDHRLFQMDLDGTLTTFDAGTGNLTGRHPGLLPAINPDDQVSYVFTGDLVYQVWADHILGAGFPGIRGADQIYAADRYYSILAVTPCGSGWLCIQTAFENEDVLQDLAVMDPVSQSLRWQKTDMPRGAVSVVGDRILSDGTELFDLGGRQLFSREASYAAWVSPDRALVLSPHATDPLSAEAIVLDVYSVAAATGRSTRIGTFRDLIGACAADERYLACPLTDAVVAWRYA